MSTATPASKTSLASTIGRIAGIIGSDHFATGERAALRRMVPDQPPPLSFYRFALSHLPEGWDRNQNTIRDWMTITAGIAIMSPNAHSLERGFGSALAKAGYSEIRFERLLSSTGNTRRVLVLRAARFLAAKNTPCNWVEGSKLLLTREEERETLHRRIAQDFYRSIDSN